MSHVLKNRFNAIPFFLLLIGLMAGCATTQPGTETNSEPSEGANVETTSENASFYKRDRPVPNSIEEEVPNSFYEAYANGTRTFSGKPGSEYWQQYAKYDIDVAIDTKAKTISGESTITYYNKSPDTLGQFYLELSQNAHKQGVPRKESTEVTGGVNLGSVVLEGDTLDTIQGYGQRGYVVDGTVLAIVPSQPLMPGDSIKLEISWDFEIPRQGAGGRMGYNKDNLFFIAYWYPQMRVYDDVIGWFTDPFLLNAEFYHGFADYNVKITAPEQWLVASTGQLSNAKEVLTSTIYERLTKAHSGDEVVTVVSEDDFGNVTKSTQDSTVTWHYKAKNIRDFAFSVTKESIWDATRTPVGDRDGNGETDYTHIDAFYRTDASLWKDAAEYSQHSLSYLSDFTGVSYPWPHMTAVEGGGIIGGGMEFPMITLIGSYKGQATESLYAVIAHEIAHMWVPMQISTNERRYSWIDEGTTTFSENTAKLDYYPEGPDYEIQDFQTYLQIAGTDYEGEIMRRSDYHYSSFAYGRASYSKPASVLVALRGVLGEETFKEAFQTYHSEWQYKHPYPWDLFNTFEDVSGRNLDWFWRSWYYETWTLDHAVTDVSKSKEGTRIIIQDLGLTPMPSHVEITFEDGSTMNKTIGVDTWLNGATTAILVIEEPSPIKKVEIDPDFLFPDANRNNNVWQKQ